MAVDFTVGIPTHNRRETVLLAVASALEQTRPPAQICVVADGCTDGTQDAVRDLGDQRVKVLDLAKGPGFGYAHRDKVLERAGDGIVAWLADDDLWLPDHLAGVGELFDAGAAEIVNAMSCLVREDGSLEPFGVHWRAPSYRHLFLGVENRTPSSAVSHVASVALAAGGWPRDVERAGDWDLWQRIVRGGARSEMVLSPTVLFFKAEDKDQQWSDRVAQNTGFLARIRDPKQLAELRAEMSFSISSLGDAHLADLAAALQAEKVAAIRVAELASLEAELGGLTAQRDSLASQLDAQTAELAAISSTRWWGLRRSLDPILRRRPRRGR